MKARWMVLSLCAAMLVAVGGLKAAKEESSKEEAKKFAATCPVSGKAAGEDHVVELKNETKVCFCCDKCKGKYESASDEEKLKLLFSNAAMKKGFKSTKEKEKKEKKA